jgi:hypothetical protein
MKNYMKKIIVGIFTLVFLFTGTQSVFAAEPFNGDPGDCNPAIAIGVYGNIARDSYGCWTSRSVYADAGDIINIAMYYHNNTNQTLTNVSGTIDKSSSGYSNNFTFTGRMYSDQGSQTIGNVSLRLSSNQKLIYKSTHVMKGAQAVKSDTDTSLVYNDGGNINIGNVLPGWDNFGEILVVYEVSDDNDDDDYNDDHNDYCEIDSFTASDTSIDRGDSSTLRWRTTDCDDVTLTNTGDVDDDGSEEVYPRTSTTYTLRAYGDNGSRTKTLRINVDQNNNYYVEPVVAYNNDIVTTIATNITQTGAILNGVITNSKYNRSAVYFNYGENTALESRTGASEITGSTNFSSYVTNLKPGTIYYFQAISDDGDINRGAVQTFRTPGYVNTVNTTNTVSNTNTPIVTKSVITQGKTIVGANSPIVLKIENRYKAIGEGDTIDYTVYYKNISSLTLTNAMVQVYIPEGITLIDISNGTYSKDDRTLSVPIGDLSKDEDGTIYLKATVDNINSNLAQIVTTAILVYTSPNDTQENAMAYVLNTQKENNNSLLGASASDSGFLGMGIIGWLLLIIAILLLMIFARSLYGRKSESRI